MALPPSKKDLTLKQQEILYCLNKIREYAYGLSKRRASKRLELLQWKLAEWEDIGIDKFNT